MRRNPLQLLRPFFQGTDTTTPTPPLITKITIPASNTGDITLLTLTRLSTKNAISRALFKELRGHITPLLNPTSSLSSTGALILANYVPGVFCAGVDLTAPTPLTPQPTATFPANVRGARQDISAGPIPTIFVVNGMALGGGLELGNIPGAGGTYHLPRLIGVSRAKDLIFTGRRLGAEEGGCEEGMEEVTRICGGGPVELRMVKRAVDDAYERVAATSDQDEGLSAFREKRKPVFKGR
ncbi:ClpP/crotonase-like domain-containing protein [Tuber brumale]|nr:ClpP/crotonase-like domain-containing protein [Tuber brumale]